ncbi:hypothetical protein ACFYQA_05735 [Streptomyces sp. NPDC005774]|uniref:hypothetical protein n=1 Tax=Streptomyces sp. NPDC005774 TaxID=3364728 RepID=UPI0036A3A304
MGPKAVFRPVLGRRLLVVRGPGRVAAARLGRAAICPVWAVVCFLSLPLALVGLVRTCAEYRASARGRTSRPHAVVGGVPALLGATAAILHRAFLATHPDLALQE